MPLDWIYLDGFIWHKELIVSRILERLIDNFPFLYVVHNSSGPDR